MFAKVSKKQPYSNFNFRVTIVSPKLGNIKCGFNSVSGLGITTTFKEYREGGNNYIADKLVETITDNPVIFSVGMTDNESVTDLSTHYFQTTNGTVGAFENRVEIIVEVMDRANGKPVKTFKLQECVIETFLLGDLNSLGAEFLIESFSVRFNALSVS